MFNGNNKSGKEFDVIDEDGDVVGSFDDHQSAADCLRAARAWYLGVCRIRRDVATQAARRAAFHSFDWGN